MSKRISLTTVLCAVCCFSVVVSNADEFNFPVLVEVKTTQDGVPLEGAVVKVGFEQRYGVDPMIVKEANSDTNGIIRCKGEASGRLTVVVKKDGYYDHFQPVPLPERGKEGVLSTNIIVCLKQIKNPVPMYAKKEKRRFPVKDIFIGYDFEKGDWVAPYGKGVLTDFLVKARFTKTDRYNYDMQINIDFPGEYNGVKAMVREFKSNEGSKLRSAHDAPLGDYESQLEMSQYRKDGVINMKEFSVENREGYYFRVRSIVDENGNLVSAQYGKIYGTFKMFGYVSSDDVGLEFKYYYNPDGTRNVELSQNENMFLRVPLWRAPLQYSVGMP